MSQDLLPIGRFARLGRLSVKQLRHYDEIGLLVPARVDADSGYRYYHPAQARQALAIGLLRSLDVPLPVIAQVLAGDSGALQEVHRELEAELARRRSTLAALHTIMEGGLPAPRVRLVTVPAACVAVATETAHGPLDLGRATSAAVARLLSGGYGTRGGLVGLFPLDLGERIEVTLTAPGGDRPLPGGLFAAARHQGPYNQIQLTAHALLAWCAEHGHQPAGPIREVYLDDPRTTAPEQLRTDLMVGLGPSMSG